MAKSPADRYQTAADMRADLQRAASGMPVVAVAPTRMDMYSVPQSGGTAATMLAGATSQIPPVQYGYGGGDYQGGGRGGGGGLRWLPWVLGLVLVVGVVVGVAYYLLAGGKTTSVPLVNNETVAQAEKAITANHLGYTVVDQANSTVAKGLVINSNPPEGKNVAANTTVTLYVSTGAQPVTVPNVVGQQESQAENALQAKGFQFTVKSDPSSSAPTG